MSSQYGEDKFILDYFRDAPGGRFLDVGAYNGVQFSNTLPLLEKGWEGTYVEPSAAPFASMLDVLGRRKPSPTFVQAAIHPVGGMIPWWDARGDALSSSNPSHVQQWSLTHSFAPCWVCGITWDQLLAACPGPYDFMNLDVEGNNCELIQLAPLDRIGAQLICFEFDPLREDVDAAMSYFWAHGYRKAAKIGNLLLEKVL